jgi:pre-mRNA-splicing factor 38A
VRILGAFYLRLTGTDVDVYRYLEPLYNDYRKLRQKLPEGRKIINLSLESAMISFSLLLSFYLPLFSYAFIISMNILIVSGFSLTHVDEVIDELLTKDYSCDIALPRIKKRYFCFQLVLSEDVGWL